jgi:hypothetical protein
MKPYYYVYKVGNMNFPTTKHVDLPSAWNESVRLADKHPGFAFEILKCCGISQIPKPESKTFWMDGENLY